MITKTKKTKKNIKTVDDYDWERIAHGIALDEMWERFSPRKGSINVKEALAFHKERKAFHLKWLTFGVTTIKATEQLFKEKKEKDQCQLK